MPLILLAIEHVVDEIDGARERTEHDEGRRGFEDGMRIVQLLGKDESAEDKQILRPLIRTKREEQIQQSSATRKDL